MKRKLMAIIALIAVGTLLFASAPQEASTGEGPVELKFWSLFTGGDGAFFDAMIEEFNASQDEIHMTNDMDKFDDYYTKLTTALAAGNAPDVIVLHQARLINYVPSGVLLPLDEYVSDEMLSDFQTAPLEACRMDGKLYAIPFDVHPIVMYTNTSLLEEAGIDKIPETAEEFTAAAKAVKEATGQWGSLIDNTTGTYKAYTLTRLFVSLVNQQGGSMLTEDMSAAAFNNEYGYNALVWLQSLVNEEAVNPNELDYDAAMNMFKLGEGAFYFNGVWATGTLEQTEGLEFAASPLPAFMGESAAWTDSHTFAIPVQKNQDPAKVEAAIKFIDWMTGNAHLWAKAGNIPTRNSVLEGEEFNALPYRADYAAAVSSVVANPPTAAWGEIYETLSDLLEAAVTKDLDPQTSLDGMEATVNEIISRY